MPTAKAFLFYVSNINIFFTRKRKNHIKLFLQLNPQVKLCSIDNLCAANANQMKFQNPALECNFKGI